MKSYHLNFNLNGKIISNSAIEDEDQINRALKEFEEQRPDITIDDLVDQNNQLSEDSPFVKIVNDLKLSLRQINQTS